jgi:hypothetical protein
MTCIRAANEIWLFKELIRTMGFSKFELRPVQSFCTLMVIRMEQTRRGKRSEASFVPLELQVCKLGASSVGGYRDKQ